MNDTFESKRQKRAPILKMTKPKSDGNHDNESNQINGVHDVIELNGLFDALEKNHHHKQSDYESQQIWWIVLRGPKFFSLF